MVNGLIIYFHVPEVKVNLIIYTLDFIFLCTLVRTYIQQGGRGV